MCRTAARHLVGEGSGLGVPILASTSTTRATRVSRTRGPRKRARTVLDASVGDSAGARSRRGRPATSAPRIGLPPPRGRRDGIDLDALIEVAEWLGRASSGGNFQDRSHGPASLRAGGRIRRRSTPYRLGVDVGGTFRDLLSSTTRREPAPRQDAVDAADPAEAAPAWRTAHCDAERCVPPAELAYAHGPTAATKTASASEGRARGPDHHEGLQADPPSRALAAEHRGGLHYHGRQARSPGGASGRA